MMICKAIAEGDELAFIKNLEKLKLKKKENPNDYIAKRDVNMFDGLQFYDVKLLVHSKDMRSALNEALQFSIQNKREVISFAIIKYGRSKLI